MKLEDLVWTREPEEIAAASQALSNMAGDMQDAVGQFKF